MMSKSFTLVQYTLECMWEFATDIFLACGALEWVVGGIVMVATASLLILPALRGGIR